MFMGTIPSDQPTNEDDLIVVRSDGEIQCLSGVNLQTRFVSPADVIRRNSSQPRAAGHRVQFACVTDLQTAQKTFLKDRESIVATVQSDSGAENKLIVLITSPVDPNLSSERTLHVVVPPSNNTAQSHLINQSVQPLLSITIPWEHAKQPLEAGAVVYNLHVSSGVLYELCDGLLTAFDLIASIASVKSQFHVHGATSLLSLSGSAIITGSPERVNIYNPAYQSLQASTAIGQTSPISKKRKLGSDEPESQNISCLLVSYSPKQNVVHGIIGQDLVAFQINAPSSRSRGLGLLKDSLRAGVPAHTNGLTALKDQTGCLCASVSGSSSPTSQEKTDELERLIAANDVQGFEELVTEEWGPQKTGKSASKLTYHDVGPRWTNYILRKILTWTPSPTTELEATEVGQLSISFFPARVVRWLIETGCFRRSCIESALRLDLQASNIRSLPAGQFITSIIAADSELDTLTAILKSHCLDADTPELLHALKILINGVDLSGQPRLPESQTLLLTASDRDLANGDLGSYDLTLSTDADGPQYPLGGDPTDPESPLNLALRKLHATCSTRGVVEGLRSGWQTLEVVSLIRLLQFKLRQGGWTDLYLDPMQPSSPAPSATAASEHDLLLVSNLLNSCIDAIGAGGWLFGDAAPAGGEEGESFSESQKLILDLKVEVSAALEGIIEAQYLKGLTAEIVRYGEAVAVSRSFPTGAKGKMSKQKPNLVEDESMEGGLLPIGLKAEKKVSKLRVGAGGEVLNRSKRDIGQLKSRKVGKYSVERIVI